MRRAAIAVFSFAGIAILFASGIGVGLRYFPQLTKAAAASGSVVGAIAIARNQPLRRLQSTITHSRAALFLAREMYEGARSRRERWPECLDRARREI